MSATQARFKATASEKPSLTPAGSAPGNRSGPSNSRLVRYGFLSDVHGDRKALERALETLADVDEVVFLGDAVGGREDQECVLLLRDRGVRSLCGNHDLDPFDLAPLPPEAREFLGGLPAAWETGDLLATHSRHRREGALLHFSYVRTEADAEELLARSAHRLVVVGHTHEAVLFSAREGRVRRRALTAAESIALEPGCRYVVNVPDARTGVVVLDATAVEYRLFRPRTPPGRDPRPVLGADRKPRAPWWRIDRS